MASSNWLTTLITSIRDLIIIGSTVFGLISLIRYLTRGKWPEIKPDGDVVAPPVAADDLPSKGDIHKWLEEKSKKTGTLLLAAALCLSLSMTGTAAVSTEEGSVRGMYEYRQILDGESQDAITNVFHVGEGLYRLHFQMRVHVYGSNQTRSIIRVIPLRLSDTVSDWTWLYVVCGVVGGGILGYAIAK